MQVASLKPFGNFGKLSVGLTGGIGSGKTTVSNLFADYGTSIIDTDVIAHSLTVSGGAAIPKILSEFGDEFITPEGAMDRQKMRQYIFSDSAAKHRLESILHPQIRRACEEAARQADSEYLIFAIPLLIESGDWVNRVDRILVVDCAPETQVSRVIQRNHFSREQVLDIMRTQVSREVRLQHADDVINSEQDLSSVRLQVEQLHQKYRKLCVQT